MEKSLLAIFDEIPCTVLVLCSLKSTELQFLYYLMYDNICIFI